MLKGLKFYRFIKITKRIGNFRNGKPHCTEFHMLYGRMRVIELRNEELKFYNELVGNNNNLSYLKVRRKCQIRRVILQEEIHLLFIV